MAKKKNNLLLILGIAAGVLIALAIVGKSAGWIGKEPVTEVETAKATRTEVVEKVSASGKVQPEVEVKITPDVPGEVIGLYVKEGDSVVKGQLLLRIKPENFISARDRSLAALSGSRANAAQAAAQVAQLQAQLQQAKLTFDRQKQLYEQKAISISDFQTAETGFTVARENLQAARKSYEAAQFSVKSAEATLKDASVTLLKTEVFAPVNGTVSKLSIEKGERVVGTSQMAGTEMLRIANLNNMEVQVDVNENDIVRVSLGDTALIEVDSYSGTGRNFKGIVTEVANTANSTLSADAVTEFQVKVRILQESYQDLLKQKKDMAPFRPGMTASVDVITERKSGILTVPLAAVTTRLSEELIPVDEKSGKPAMKIRNVKATDEKVTETKTAKKEAGKEVVFVMENGKAVAREVKTGISDYDNIEIVSGIKEGDEVITGPYNVVSKKLRNGEKIKKKENPGNDKNPSSMKAAN
jgi:HlyD family secretion protein